MPARPVVLIGFADALAAPETVFSLQAAGFSPRVLERDGRPSLAGRRLPVGAPIRIPAPERDAAASVAALRAAAREGVDAALALDDAALWLMDAAFGGGDGPRLASAAGAQARFALDKRLQLAAAARAGFDAPPTRIADGPDAVDADAWPAIVKPALAGQIVEGRLARGGAAYLHDAVARDGAAAAGALAGALWPALVQPLIAGVGEGLFGFAAADGVRAWSAHRRVRMMNPHGSGASACVSVLPDPAAQAAAARFVAEIGWRGPFMLEFLRGEDGRRWFMEFNGRLWGSTALARRLGLEYPAWAVMQALDPGFSPDAPPPRAGVAVRHLGRDVLHLLHVLRGPRTAFHRAGWPSLRRSALAALAPAPGRDFYNHDPAHPWYFLRDAAATVAAGVRRR